MSLIKFLVPFLFYVAAANAQVTTTDAPDTAAEPPVATQTKQIPYYHSRLEFSVGQIQWSEEMQLQQGTESDVGLASYQGLFLGLEKNWTRYRWMMTLSGGFALGRATAGNFENLSFDDGKERGWQGAFFSPQGFYRATKEFGVGLGAFTFWRQGDWQPQDASLQVQTSQGVILSPELSLRWRPLTSLTLNQSLVLLPGDRYSLWRWTLLWRL